MERNMASKLTIHKVQPGEAKVGCDPRGVQIFYKESTTLKGNPNLVYLSDLLKKHGFQVKEGDQVSDTPLRFLCVAKAGGTVTREDVLKVLQEDQEIDLTNVNRPEGNRGSE
jgi:hypothetical protein